MAIKFFKEFSIKRLVLFGLLFVIASGVGTIIFERLVLPQLQTVPIFRDIKFFDPRVPIVITRREEIRIDSGVNTQEVVNRVRGSLVKIYASDKKLAVGQVPDAVISGIFATNDGLILSPAVDAALAANLKVVLQNGSVYDGKLVFTDKLSAINFIKIEANGLPVQSSRHTEELNLGERLLAVRLEEDQTVAVKVRVLGRKVSVHPSLSMTRDLAAFDSLLEIEPPLVETDYGSAVVDKDGSLVGFATQAGIIRSEDIERTLGLFLGSDDGRFVWPRLAINYYILSPGLAELVGLPARHGILVKQGGHGLQSNDFIIAVDGRAITLEETFQDLIFVKKPGEKARLKLLRQGLEREVEITL